MQEEEKSHAPSDLLTRAKEKLFEWRSKKGGSNLQENEED